MLKFHWMTEQAAAQLWMSGYPNKGDKYEANTNITKTKYSCDVCKTVGLRLAFTIC